MRTKIIAVLVTFLALAVLPAASGPGTSSGGQKPQPNNHEVRYIQELLRNHHEVKHVIIMVADGMGLADVTAARIRKNGIDGASLRFETLDEIGYQRTYSEKNTVTDSAAAASAWACGEKFVNDEICLHGDGRPNNATLLELAKEQGWATGLVTTQAITNATPAAFGAHVTFRDCENEIARQYVQVTRPDVMLGGGKTKFKPTPAAPDPCGGSGDYILAAQAAGYTYVTDSAGLQIAAADGARRLLGLFRSAYMTPEIMRPPTSTEPHLSEMAAAALDTLERVNHRFFVMIEGGLIDLANHVEWLDGQVKEVSAFDDAVGVVLDWIDAKEERRQHTLLIVIADHETGGFAVMGSEVAGAEPLGTFADGWTFVMPPPPPSTKSVAGHTGTDTMVWSQGPGSAALGRAIDNTTIYEVVNAVLRPRPPERDDWRR
jgi:alkaline phosphatase